MSDLTDSQLLQRLSGAGAQDAFGALVARYNDLVFSACLRQLRNMALAEDAAQAVFLVFSKKAADLPHTIVLSGWLFNTTRFVCASMQKMERRRKKHEEVAATMRAESESTADVPAAAAAYSECAPVLDAALTELRAGDRDALLLKFFQNKSMADIGAALGVSATAAQKRIERALEKLKSALRRRNVTTTEVTLASVLLLGVRPAPAELTAKIQAVCSGKVAASAGAAAGAQAALSGLFWAKLQIALVGLAALLGAAIPAIYFAMPRTPAAQPATVAEIAATETPRPPQMEAALWTLPYKQDFESTAPGNVPENFYAPPTHPRWTGGPARAAVVERNGGRWLELGSPDAADANWINRASIVFGAKDWKNYEIEFRAQCGAAPQDLRIRLNCASEYKSFYEVLLKPGETAVSTVSLLENRQRTAATAPRGAFAPGQPRRVRVETRGKRIELFVDEDPVLRFDGEWPVEGECQITVTTGTVWLDDLAVRNVRPEDSGGKTNDF